MSNVMPRVAAAIVGVGGAGAIGIAGYNLGYSDRVDHDQRLELASPDAHDEYRSPQARAIVRAADERYATTNGKQNDDWRAEALGFGISGIATLGLAGASLLTRNPVVAGRLAIGAGIAGANTLVAGILTRRTWSEWARSPEPVREQNRDYELANGVERLHQAQVSAPAMPVVTPVAGGSGDDLRIRARVDEYAAETEATTYATDEYAGIIGGVLGAAGDAGAGLRELIAVSAGLGVPGPEHTSDEAIASALDVDRDGTLTADERRAIWSGLDLAKYAALRQEVAGVVGEEGPRFVTTLMEEIAAGRPISAAGYDEKYVGMAALQFDLAGHMDLGSTASGSIDWSQVVQTADRALERLAS